ncbi:putative Integral membrane sensor signal transduction histidine kinase [Desulfamplus magnetovallimortis]|uniref:histidine kinase n=1 Tax=Desulfamplus magnetovallimortis TaxID=1246637 RepID=A0A1W1HBC9_9BACT|nr:MASE3 domain-containing protein [Desulfamplus magnetovallimortis]SLM29678.1 putative Integral membrane sensor signal transduction histidine kinase [Desulfamplus magnetovallimortis]
MRQNHKLPYQHPTEQSTWIFPAVIGIVGLVGLVIISRYNFLLFHSFAELFSIAVAWALFFLVWNTRYITDADSLVFVGIAYFFIGIVDLLHTLAYKGMGVFSTHWGANLPTQLWILARYMESVSFLMLPLLFRRKIQPVLLFGCWTGATMLLLGTIFFWQVFPDCYMEGVGLTRFKIFSEYAICMLLGSAYRLLYMKKGMLDPLVFRLLALSIAMTICAELAFTFYVSVYDFSNLLGHYFKIISFYLLYIALVHSGLTRPYQVLFKSLKDSENKYQNAYAQTEKMVRERTRELERSNDELAQFAYVASHDLQEPLRAIVGFLQLLESRYTGQLDEKGRQYIKRSVNAGHRMQSLIQDLLALSRINTKDNPFESMDLNDVVTMVLNRLEKQIQEKAGIITADRLPNLEADATQIHTLFQNLISNALKYNERSEPAISIGCKEQENDYCFFIKDNGIGIESKFYERIFVVFQRLHSRQEYSGTGVGLTLCKKIVERHGGYIWVESEKDHGSTFFFTLPKERIKK